MGSKPKGPNYKDVTRQLEADTQKLLSTQRTRSTKQTRQTRELRKDFSTDSRGFQRLLKQGIAKDLRLDRQETAVLTGFLSELVKAQERETQRARGFRAEEQRRLLGLEAQEQELFEGTLQLQTDLGDTQLDSLARQGELQREFITAQEDQLARQRVLQEGVFEEFAGQEQRAINQAEAARLRQNIDLANRREAGRQGFLSSRFQQREQRGLRNLRRFL